MEHRPLGHTGLQTSAIGLGTWVMGGSFWGGAEDRDSLATIRRAIELKITLIDTAPIYGHGRAEALVGQAVQESGQRDRLIIATKVGLEWNPLKTKVWRDSSRTRIGHEIGESLRRLRTDYIDIYQVHWPDRGTPYEETMAALVELKEKGLIRFIGLSNFDVAQTNRCLSVGPVHVMQPPYNLFERKVESDLLPFCREHGVAALAYGPLCRGLLAGKYRGSETFTPGDIRTIDPKFNAPRFERYVACVDRLRTVAARSHKSVAQLAVRWCLDQPGVTVALCGARRPDQIEETADVSGWVLSVADRSEIDRIISETVIDPVGPEFMQPP